MDAIVGGNQAVYVNEWAQEVLSRGSCLESRCGGLDQRRDSKDLLLGSAYS